MKCKQFLPSVAGLAVPPIISYGTSKVMPKISVHDLMTISRVLLLIIGQNDINPKLLQPIVASICKVMTVKKPCVCCQPELTQNV